MTFSGNTTISETNTAYEGQDIVISGATVVIDGSHAFHSLVLTNGAVLTHLRIDISHKLCENTIHL